MDEAMIIVVQNIYIDQWELPILLLPIPAPIPPPPPPSPVRVMFYTD